MKQLTAAISCLFLSLILVGCHSHDQDSFYAVLADARKAGEIDRGWIPDFIPGSSRSIHEVHDLSPSKVWCAFEFDPSDTGSLRSNLKSVDSQGPVAGYVSSPHEPWWPRTLQGNLDASKVHGAGLQIYTVEIPVTQVENEIMLFAIDWSNGHGYFTNAWDGAEPR